MTSAIITGIQLVIFFILPGYLMRFARSAKIDKWLSDIVICYGIGMLLGNTKSLWLYSLAEAGGANSDLIATITSEVAKNSASVAVLLAMPMLLMINNVSDWLKYTGKISVVFFLGVISTISVCTVMGYFYRDSLPEVATAAGMFTGVYIGGTPNMVAISKALNAPDSLFVILNATDTICSGLYYLFLLSLGQAVLGFVLPHFKSRHTKEELEAEVKEDVEHPFPPQAWTWMHLRSLAIATLIAIGAIVFAVVPALLFPDVKGELNQPILMLALTTVGIALSFISHIRTLHGVYNYAQYLLLIFGLSAGFMTDFSLLVDVGSDYLKFDALVVLFIVLTHLTITFFVRGDTDSFMISSTACIMGPPFVAQLCSSIKNRELLPVGIALALLGFGIANYAGMLVAWLVQKF